jgi:hypothetical protein
MTKWCDHHALHCVLYWKTAQLDFDASIELKDTKTYKYTEKVVDSANFSRDISREITDSSHHSKTGCCWTILFSILLLISIILLAALLFKKSTSCRQVSALEDNKNRNVETSLTPSYIAVNSPLDGNLNHYSPWATTNLQTEVSCREQANTHVFLKH